MSGTEFTVIKRELLARLFPSSIIACSFLEVRNMALWQCPSPD